jgi:cation:H+ antiporter
MTQHLPLTANAIIFLAAAVAVWFAGNGIANDADDVSDRTGLGRAFVGLVLLATATSLPEIATTSAAALAGNAALVLGNLFGGITMQTAILAAADGLLVAGVLTMYPRKPTHALEAILLVILLSVLLAACIFGERELAFGIGAGTMLLGLCYGGSIWLLRRYDANSDWIPLDLPEAVPVANSRPRPRQTDLPLSRLYWRMTGYAALILAGGIVLVTSAEAIAVQSGLGASFVGVTVLAAATSLPEISTTFAAVRLGAYTMAISNIFGSNLIMLALLLPADMLYREGTLLAAAGRSELLALIFGLMVTAIYVAGMLVRRKPKVLGMGLDSALVLAVYATSLATLYACADPLPRLAVDAQDQLDFMRDLAIAQHGKHQSAAGNIARQHRQEELQHHSGQAEIAMQHKHERFDAAGHHVRKAACSDDVGHQHDHPELCRLCRRQHPHQRGNQPAREYAPHEHLRDVQLHHVMTDPQRRIENFSRNRPGAHKRGSEQQTARKIGRQHNAPQPERAPCRAPRRRNQQRQHGRHGVLREQLQPRHDDDHKSERVPETLNQMTPRLIGQVGTQHGLAHNRKTDGDPRHQARQGQ